eukprot:scaffold10057_cov140-Isochrysis_galbana.AAC.5
MLDLESTDADGAGPRRDVGASKVRAGRGAYGGELHARAHVQNQGSKKVVHRALAPQMSRGSKKLSGVSGPGCAQLAPIPSLFCINAGGASTTASLALVVCPNKARTMGESLSEFMTIAAKPRDLASAYAALYTARINGSHLGPSTTGAQRRARKAVREEAHRYMPNVIAVALAAPPQANFETRVAAYPAQNRLSSAASRIIRATGSSGASLDHTLMGKKNLTTLKPVKVDPFQRTSTAVDATPLSLVSAEASVAAKVAR